MLIGDGQVTNAEDNRMISRPSRISSTIERAIVVVGLLCLLPRPAVGGITPATGSTTDRLINQQGSGVPTEYGDYTASSIALDSSTAILATNLTVAQPAVTAAGGLPVAMISTRGNVAQTAPGGWALIGPGCARLAGIDRNQNTGSSCGNDSTLDVSLWNMLCREIGGIAYGFASPSHRRWHGDCCPTGVESAIRGGSRAESISVLL